jgi:hypothetical protein
MGKRNRIDFSYIGTAHAPDLKPNQTLTFPAYLSGITVGVRVNVVACVFRAIGLAQ